MTGEGRNPVEVLGEDYVSRIRRGEEPDIAEYATSHPEWREEIEELFPAMLLAEQWNPRSSGSLPPAGPQLERLGDFRIIRELGRGGMGIVYEAEQVSLGRRVALKVLPTGALLTPRQVERFRREASASAKLHHTNIVPVFGVGEHDGLHYYAMQLISGRGLDEILATAGKPWAPREAAGMARQAAAALSHAHSRGTLHRDIKPANLLLDESGTVRVGDFGLAKALTDEDGLTATGDVVGTVRYMAPERFEGSCDGRSDLYALGLTLYEALTGRPAFDGTDRLNLVRRVREETPPAPRKLVPAIPRDLETIVLKAIARDPEHRYASADALAEDLQRFLDDRPILARRAGPIERAARWCRRNRALAAVGGVAIFALVLAAAAGWVGNVATSNALVREAERRAEAEAATRRAEANETLSLASFEAIFEALPGPDEKGGSRDRREKLDAALLEGVISFYDRFAEQNGSNPRLRLEAAKAHRRVGMIQDRRDRAEEASAAFGRAVASLEGLTEEFPGDPVYLAELAETYAASSGRAAGTKDLETAVRRCDDAIRIALDLTTRHPDEPRHAKALMVARSIRAATLARLERADEAQRELREAVRIRADLLERFGAGAFEPSEELGRAREALAATRRRAGRFEEARRLLKTAIHDLGTGPDHLGLKAKLHERLAEVLRRLGDRGAASDAERRADEMRREDRRRPGGGRRGNRRSE